MVNKFEKSRWRLFYLLWVGLSSLPCLWAFADALPD